MNKKYAAMALCGLLTACQSDRVEYKYPQKVYGRYEMPSEKIEQDTVFDKKYLTFSIGGQKEDKNPVRTEGAAEKSAEINARRKTDLWPFVLPVLSQYPIALMQRGEFASTEWFTDPENASRQLKINAAKVGTDVKITVLCRQKDENGEWINQKNDATLADKIKNDIVKQSFNN